MASNPSRRIPIQGSAGGGAHGAAGWLADGAAALQLNDYEIMADQALEPIYATFPDWRARQQEIVQSLRLAPTIVALILGE
jgi:hypothetical protein